MRVLCEDHYYGERCVNLNECSAFQDCSGNGRCTDSIMSFNCDCNPGYTGRQCQIDIDECLLVEPECSGHGTCTYGVNSFICDCNEGFTGLMCETNINDCVGVNCSGHGQCMDGVNNFTCHCQSGFTGYLCSVNVYGNKIFSLNGKSINVHILEQSSGSSAGRIAGWVAVLHGGVTNNSDNSPGNSKTNEEKTTS